MVMTEKMLAELLGAIEMRLVKIGYVNKSTRKYIVRIVEDELRNSITIGTLPPASFPAELIHDGDYYTEDCPPKSSTDKEESSCSDWKI